MEDRSSKKNKTRSINKQWYPGLPLVEILGNKRVLIERHQGVLAYNTEVINIQVACGEICIRGSDLILTKMSKEQLVIFGKIQGVTLSGRR